MQQNTTSNTKKFLLVGNPNVGKSTLFNALCNRKQKTGNYAGVTVSSLMGDYIYKEEKVIITDLPGSYSVYPTSKDEAVFSEKLLSSQNEYNGVIYLLEALSIKRGLLLFRQIQDLGIPLILVINQIDQAKKRGIDINIDMLEQKLGVKVITTNAKDNIGVDELRESLFNAEYTSTDTPSFHIPLEQKRFISESVQDTSNNYRAWVDYASSISKDRGVNIKRLQVQETVRRYQSIDEILTGIITKKAGFKELLTEKLDKVLVHKFWGYIIFTMLLLPIFQLVFTIAQYPMEWIEDGFGAIQELTESLLPEGPINSLITSGIIPGIGAIVVFAPQIFILLYLLYVLEDSGYMARVVFLMDRLLRPFGLNGKSIVPLVSGTACAVPAIMAARNIENVKERLITILVTPFMACSARLPIYSIIISLIIPDESFLGISYKALMLLLMYFLGFAMALISAFVLKKVIKPNQPSFLVMDLPTYKMPLWWEDLKLTLSKVWAFITGAGKVIFTVSVILWVLSYFGESKNQDEWVATDVELKDSYLSQVGAVIQPAIEPLGYDWKMGIGILTSFAARETFVATISTLYSLDEDAPEGKIIEKMQADLKPDGTKVFSFATGLSILMFYAFAMQCISTIAIVYKETKSIKLTLLQLVGMTGIAYIASLFVYQIFK